MSPMQEKKHIFTQNWMYDFIFSAFSIYIAT